jgi:hypothetical protein
MNPPDNLIKSRCMACHFHGICYAVLEGFVGCGETNTGDIPGLSQPPSGMRLNHKLAANRPMILFLINRGIASYFCHNLYVKSLYFIAGSCIHRVFNVK